MRYAADSFRKSQWEGVNELNKEDFENEIEIEEAENALDNESELADEEPSDETELIPAYTQADFLTGFAPFEWIYQSKDNKLQYAQRIELMKAQAKAVGITGFMKLWKAYLESIGTVSPTLYDNLFSLIAVRGKLLTMVFMVVICLAVK